MKRRNLWNLAACAAALPWLEALSVSAAGDFPTRPVRVVVPTAAGSAPDVYCRKLAQRLSRRWGQQVVVDNRPGAATTLGAKLVADAPADGYTLLYGLFNTLAVAPHLFAKLPFDPVRDFAPITIAAKTAFVLVAHASVQARSLQELMALGKRAPGTLRYGSGGPGTPQHILGAMLERAAGMDAVHVPYKSAPPALIDLVGGHLHFMFEAVVTTKEHVAAGTLRVLAVTSRERMKEYPEVPTLAELGVSQEDWTLWGGFLAPARTPAALVAQLNADIRAENESPDFVEDVPGARRAGSTPAEFAKYIASETVKWKRLVELSGARIE